MTTETPVPTLTIEELRAVTDPAERVQAAAAFLSTVEQAFDTARALRGDAALALVGEGLRPSRVYKDIIAVSRGTWTTVMARGPVGGHGVTFRGKTIDQIRAIAVTAAADARTHKDAQVEARQIRNDGIKALSAAGTPNNSLVDLTGLTSARIAQITGTRQ